MPVNREGLILLNIDKIRYANQTFNNLNVLEMGN